jgi:lysophospholipase L1-like esterase
LAEKLDYEIYRLAVGRTSIKLPVIEMFNEFKKIDLLTLYIGINDSALKSLEKFKQEYDQMLTIIRKNHPDTKIFSITIHAIPKDKTSKHTSTKLIDFRKPVTTLVQKRQQEGDKNLFLIHGESLSTLGDAANPGNVHLSIDGAKHWAEKLYPQIKKSL